MTKYTFADLEDRYQSLTGFVRCSCVFSTELVGGQPADEKSINAFTLHHLGITDEKERASAVRRILKEEVGEKDVRPEEGELDEKQVYGVRVIRRDEHGPYLGNWMVKACIKQAASRLSIFKDVRGTKGNFAESGRVSAISISLVDDPTRIYLRGPNDKAAQTYYQEFMGRVQTPTGPTSIVHHSECVPVGTRFEFEYRFMVGTLKEEDIRDVLAMAMIMGLGSAKSLERGKFRIETCEIETAAEKPDRKKKSQAA